MKYLADIGADFFGAGVNKLDNVTGIGAVATLVVKGAFTVAGIAILYFFVLAGFGMIQGAGKNDPKQMEQAKATATSAIIGFIVVFTSYWIVKLIESLTGVSILQ